MSDIQSLQRDLGRLEGKVDAMLEFETNEHVKIDGQFGEINRQLTALNTWKLKVVYTSAGALLVGWALGKPINTVLDKLLSLFL